MCPVYCVTTHNSVVDHFSATAMSFKVPFVFIFINLLRRMMLKFVLVLVLSVTVSSAR